MKILFLCGSAEPGKDGVGDYTRRLCGELIRNGVQAQILSLCDRQAVNFVSQNQMIEDTPVLVRRIPMDASYKQRLVWTQETLKEEVPDWISLQFVSYSFHAKGLPFWLPGFLKDLKGAHQWHAMFHEVVNPINSLINFFIRILQFIILIRINNAIKLKSVNSSLHIYRRLLKKININSTILNLFSNIPLCKKQFIKEKSNFIIGFFSQIEPIPQVISALEKLLTELDHFNVKIILIGGNFKKTDFFIKCIESNNKINVELVKTGFINELEISSYLISCDIGLTPIHSKILSKSGSVAAFIEHGIPVYAPNYSIGNQSEHELIYNNKFRILNSLTISDLKKHNYSIFPKLLSITANQFINQLNKND